MPIAPAADALVIFGVTGDLAAKMLLPALAQLADRGVTPRIVGVAHAPREPGDIQRNVRDRLAGHDAALAGRLVEHHDCPDGTCEALRFRRGPGTVTLDLDTQRLCAGTAGERAPVTLHAALPHDEDRDAYVNLLGAALAGDHSMSERAAAVTAAWRIVEDILTADIPVHPYPDGSWGPAEADRLLRAQDRWVDPAPA